MTHEEIVAKLSRVEIGDLVQILDPGYADLAVATDVEDDSILVRSLENEELGSFDRSSLLRMFPVKIEIGRVILINGTRAFTATADDLVSIPGAAFPREWVDALTKQAGSRNAFTVLGAMDGDRVILSEHEID